VLVLPRFKASKQARFERRGLILGHQLLPHFFAIHKNFSSVTTLLHPRARRIVLAGGQINIANVTML
jgi:hypothetical protein